MKSLALVLPAMRIGGAEKIALNFIPRLQEHFKVTLVLGKLEGELLSEVPDGVEIVEDRLLTFSEVLKEDFKHFRVGKILRDFIYYAKIKLGKNSDKNYRYLVSRTPPLDRHFDIAIAYVANVSTEIFSVLDRTNAKKKFAWIHGETTNLTDIVLYEECYSGYDKIFCVSGVSKEHFINKFPSLSDRCEVFYNPINRDRILEMSREEKDIKFSEEKINILSVGRVTSEKGYDMVPEITRLLVDRGYPVRFYIVGDGSDMPRIQEKIEEYAVGEYVVPLGAKTNPYPYMRDCDIYVQPSYEEGYSTTICEAGILGSAIVGTTTSGGIREQVEDGVSALIADPTPQDIADKIERLIKDNTLKEKIKDNIKKIRFEDRSDITALL